MKRAAQSVKVHLARTFLLTGVLASLCFSVGEGLRLLPYLGPVIVVTELKNVQAGIVSTPRIPTLTGSSAVRIKMPAPAQKRIKRQPVHASTPLSWYSYELRTNAKLRLPQREPLSYRPPLALSGPSDRAPPRFI